MEHEEIWTTLLSHAGLRQLVTGAAARLRELLRERGWSEELVEALDPLLLAGFSSPYANLYLKHPGNLLPYDEDLQEAYLLDEGLILIGATPSGDSIAVRAAAEVGPVAYMSHEEFDYDDLSTLESITRRVADSVPDYLFALCSETEPLDYWDRGEQ